MSLLLAVDAGGSTCRFALETDGGRVDLALGAANVTSDFDGALRTLVSGLSELAKKAGLRADALNDAPACLALAGVTGPDVAARVAGALPLRHAVVEDDQRAGVIGALGERAGCLAGIGTGSFVARQTRGDLRFLGGHGLILGDEASGAWLGRGLLTRALHAHDGLAPRTPLTDELLSGMGGNTGIIAFARRAVPADFATLAPRVTRGDDPASRALMREGARYLEAAIAALGRREGEPLCLVGGVGPAYADYLDADLRTALVPPEGTTLDGALTLARRLAGPRSG
ncbi:BadF/BadG/BcrA/BcrD ATPase family protein [Salipiger sp.]|uniref:BadF/BadG/BcrA/BcrD ATPase family protein n=1 Tax=Salipiger sp. TaxID=2078585 RepID=UPI003A96F950